MKILAFVDTHADEESINIILNAAKEADLLVCAGDITSWGSDARKVLDRFKSLNKPLLMIHGNHEDDVAFRKLCKKYNFISFIHKGSYQTEKYVFFGYGGGGFASRNHEFERIAEKFVKTLKEGSIVILITHGPPYGTHVDYIEGMGHRGCKSLRKFIDKVKPLVHICGHLHENFDVKEVVGSTLVINPGPSGKILEI